MDKKLLDNVVNISLPAIGETILYNIIAMFDIMLVGRFAGRTAIGVAGLSNEILLTFSNIFVSLGLSIAITSLIARTVGANNYKLAEEYASLGFIIGLFLSIIIAYIFFKYPREILIFAGAKGDVLNLGIDFMKICSMGIFFSMVSSILCSILRGYGDTTTPFILSSIIILVNLTLDIGLIFGKCGLPSLGIMGAAMAKTISQFLGFIFIFLYVLFKSQIKLRLKYMVGINLKKIEELFAFSIPCSLEEAAYCISRLLSNFMIMHCSTTAYAANQIANTVESFSIMPVVGLGMATTSIIGLEVGKNNNRKARSYTKICLQIGIASMVICSIFFLIMPETLIKFFIKSSEKEVISLSSACLRLGAFEQPFLAVSIVATGAMKGAGNAKTPFIITLITSWCIRLPLIFYFIYFLRLSVVHVWWITALQWAFDAIATYLFVRKKFMT